MIDDLALVGCALVAALVVQRVLLVLWYVVSAIRSDEEA